MAATVTTMTQFRKGQKVSFIGGSGTVKNYLSEFSNWFYLVEMEMGPEPEMGRIGYETTILLSQTDLSLQDNIYCAELAVSA